jgi:bifunctional NMN adenylyltransferase/nudix hydrolase
LESGQRIPEGDSVLQYLPQPMKDYLNNLHQFNPDLQSDFLEYLKEEETFKTYPYRGLREGQEDHLNVACADIILECSGHVLTITRAHSPGKGAKAWPGGHKKAWETYLDCAFRELGEETNIRVPERTLRRCIVATHLFDHVGRNVGSVSRHSYGVYVKLDPREDGSFPLVRGCDDAKNDHLPNGGAGWTKKELILSGKVKMHDDHSDMLAFFHR